MTIYIYQTAIFFVCLSLLLCERKTHTYSHCHYNDLFNTFSLSLSMWPFVRLAIATHIRNAVRCIFYISSVFFSTQYFCQWQSTEMYTRAGNVIYTFCRYISFCSASSVLVFGCCCWYCQGAKYFLCYFYDGVKTKATPLLSELIEGTQYIVDNSLFSVYNCIVYIYCAEHAMSCYEAY